MIDNDFMIIGHKSYNYGKYIPQEFKNDLAYRKIFKEKFKKGVEEGRAEGIAEGEAIGIKKVAKVMLDEGTSLEKVSKTTGLNINELQLLAAEVTSEKL